LMLLLSDIGRTDVALTLATQVGYPSWAFEFHQNIETEATTLWELWDSEREGPGMNSRNHIMFGSVSHWFYRSLAGLNQATAGFASPVIAPPDANILMTSILSSVDASIITPFGTLSSSWARAGGERCAEGYQDKSLKLSCGPDGGVIKSIEFASFGNPSGDCAEGYQIDPTCHAPASRNLIERACLNQTECEIEVHPAVFGMAGPECITAFRKLTVSAICSAAATFQLQTTIPVNTKAEIHVSLLSYKDATITEGGKNIWANDAYVPGTEGFYSGTKGTNEVIFVAGSGQYNFVVSGTQQLHTPLTIANHGETLQLSCPENTVISHVKRASYGTHDTQHELSCQHTGSSKHVVEQLCLTRSACQIPVSQAAFGGDCAELETQKFLSVQAYCS